MRPLEPDDPRFVHPAGAGGEAGGRGYRILARIGSGGMGTVYFGRSAGGRAVAIKLVHPELAEDPEFRARFRREAAAARRVGGAFTAPLIDADPDADVPWLVTEFLPAVPLGEAVRDAGPPPPAAVRTLAAGIAEALAAIHRAGIVHRDLKPANVLLTADGPRVIDFGIARAVDAATVTRPGTPVGSPGFMSPEQVAGAEVGPPGDVFSFGATLAFACTGREPFGGGPWQEVMRRIEAGEPRLDGITDPELRDLVVSCLDRAPERRPTAEELVARLSAPRGEGTSPSAPWPPPAIAAEIARRAGEAENPPVAPAPAPAAASTPHPTPGPAPASAPAPAPGPGPASAAVVAATTGPRGRARRVPVAAVAAGAVASALVAGGVIVAWPGSGDGTASGTVTATGTAPANASASASPAVRRTAPATRSLEFYITGDVTLTSVTYTVNGQATTLRKVKPPWRQVVQVPALPQRSRWRLQYRFPPGEIRWRVLFDGFETSSGVAAAAGQSGTGDYKGTG